MDEAHTTSCREVCVCVKSSLQCLSVWAFVCQSFYSESACVYVCVCLVNVHICVCYSLANLLVYLAVVLRRRRRRSEVLRQRRPGEWLK